MQSVWLNEWFSFVFGIRRKNKQAVELCTIPYKMLSYLPANYSLQYVYKYDTCKYKVLSLTCYTWMDNNEFVANLEQLLMHSVMYSNDMNL